MEITKNCIGSADCNTGSAVFSITVTGNNPQPSSFTLLNGQTQAVTLGPGSFRIMELLRPGFVPTFTGDCKQTEPGTDDATGTISAGQNLHCTITNTLE